MPNTRVKFSQLRQLLLDCGFGEGTVDDKLGFLHEPSDWLIVLPRYRSNAVVAPHHLAYVRVMLDGKGLLDGGEFDRRLDGVSASRSASS
jgi:hypothetical protein